MTARILQLVTDDSPGGDLLAARSRAEVFAAAGWSSEVVAVRRGARQAPTTGGRSAPPPILGAGVGRATDTPFSAVCVEAVRSLLETSPAQVLVTTSTPLLALAAAHRRPGVGVIHVPGRAPWAAPETVDAFPAVAAAADVLVLPDEASRSRCGALLGTGGPVGVVVPATLAPGPRPRSDRRSTLVTVAGRIAHGARWTTLAAAAQSFLSAHPEWRWQIVGQGRAGKNVPELLQQAGIGHLVDLPGWTDRLEHTWASTGIAVVVGPHEAEAGAATLDAAAAGLPVIGVDVPETVARLIEGSGAGVVVGGSDVDGLVAAVTSLRSLAARDERGDAALRLAAERGPMSSSEQWAGILRTMTARREVDPASVRGPAGPAQPAPGRGAAVPLGVMTPHDVATSNAEIVTAVLAATDLPQVQVPGEVIDRIFAVPLSHAPALLAALGQVTDPTVRVRWAESHGEVTAVAAVAQVPDSARRLQVYREHVSASGTLRIGADAAATVEFWQPGDLAPEHLLPPAANPLVGSLPAAAFVPDPATGRCPAQRLLSGTPPERVTFPVDAVYLWVDGDDPAWRLRRDAALGVDREQTLHRLSTEDSRFRSRDELRYSLRSLWMFAPWIRHVYVVTDDQRPSWLQDGERLTVVDHRDVFPDTDMLPTFNSHAIASVTHRIEGLSEQYLVMNDDVMFGRPVSPELFFDASGASRYFLSRATIPVPAPGQVLPPHEGARLRVAALLERDLGRTISQVFKHTPVAFRRSVMTELHERYRDELGATLHSRFRSVDDLEIGMLHHYYGAATGRTRAGSLRYSYVDVGRASHQAELERLLSTRSFDTFCLNDSANEDEAPIPPEVLARFLEAYLPVVSPFERPAD